MEFLRTTGGVSAKVVVAWARSVDELDYHIGELRREIKEKARDRGDEYLKASSRFTAGTHTPFGVILPACPLPGYLCS